MNIPPQPARRVLLGYKKPGDDVLTAYTADGILPIRPEYRAAPAATSDKEQDMTQQPDQNTETRLYSFSGNGPISVTCVDRPAKEAADAARGWAFMIDSDDVLPELPLTWGEWIKRSPLLRRLFR